LLKVPSALWIVQPFLQDIAFMLVDHLGRRLWTASFIGVLLIVRIVMGQRIGK
jgi:hypothetical protein